MYDQATVSQQLNATKEHLFSLFTSHGEEFDAEAFEDLLASLKDAVDSLGIDLAFISGNDFAQFSEYALDYAENHPARGEATISGIHEDLDELLAMADDEAEADDFLRPIAELITKLAALVYPHFENGDEEDLLCELSVFDYTDGIDEVDEDAGFDETTDF